MRRQQVECVLPDGERIANLHCNLMITQTEIYESSDVRVIFTQLRNPRETVPLFRAFR